MKTVKRDWSALKGEYLKCKPVKLQDFFEDRKEPIKYNAYTQRQSFGWYKEKKELGKSAIKKAIKKVEKEKELEVQDLVSNMIAGKSKGIQDLITTLEGNQDISVRDRIEILKFIKLELGETGEIVESRDNSFKIILN